MFKDITLGQYFPADSPVHRLDPRYKILIIFIFTVALFMINSFIPYIALGIWLFIVAKASSVPPKMLIKGIKPLRWIIILTFVMNIFFIPGTPLVTIGPLTIAREGLIQAIFIAIRLVFLVIGTSLLTLTTSPIELTDGIEKLLEPLKKIGVPVQSIAMIMTIALRFIPTLIEETEKIIKAQTARGADFEGGNIIEKSKNLVPIMVPIFINALRRADELSQAMESRCYRGEGFRTRLHSLKITKTDNQIFLVHLVFFVLICATRFLHLWI